MTEFTKGEGVSLATEWDAPMIHVEVREKLRWFEYGHLPADLQEVSKPFADLAHLITGPFGLRGPQLMIGLQHLLEAKDCAVRAAKAQENP